MNHKINLIITAGGTTERIDDVRSITNTSTGSLGRAVAEAFLKNHEGHIGKIFYICGQRAKSPKAEAVEVLRVGGAKDLLKVLQDLLEKEEIDGVVHSMAVSDYTVKEVSTVDAIRSGQKLTWENKISSSVEDLAIILEKTPKVIESIKNISPNTVLVGFKLLSHVSKEELIETAYKLLVKNRCDFVLANDLKDIKGSGHRGYLVDREKSYSTMETKEEIAEQIAAKVMETVSAERNKK